MYRAAVPSLQTSATPGLVNPVPLGGGGHDVVVLSLPPLLSSHFPPNHLSQGCKFPFTYLPLTFCGSSPSIGLNLWTLRVPMILKPPGTH